jgi:outer membrane lipoprotein SlyB
MNTKSWYTPSVVATALCAAMVVTACGPQNGEPVAAAPAPAKTPAPAPAPTYRAAAPAPAPAPVRSDRLGQVSSIEPITETPKATGVGAVAGGVLGGVLGHQIGNGTGRDVATVAGAVGGAVVGNKIEKNRSEKVVGYRVHVTLDNGEQRTFEQTGSTGLQVGDRVRVDGNQVRRS